MAVLIGVAEDLNHQRTAKCLGGGRPPTSRHSDISALREAAAKPSRSSLIIYAVLITLTEQSPTLNGHTYTQLYRTREVQ